jgi:HEAT repeat protein
VAPTPTTTTAPTTITTTTTTTTTTTPAESDNFIVTDLLIEPEEVEPDETVNITVVVTNNGGSQGSYDVELYINGLVEEVKSVTLAAGANKKVSFSISREISGNYTVDISELTGKFTVVLPISIKVKITKAETWREGEEPYDIYGAIEEALLNTGIKVAGESDPYHATLYAEYTETKGKSYTGGDYGTNIRCNIQVLDNAGGVIFEREISDSTAAIVWGDTTLYESAVYCFLDEVYFKYLGQIIATGFGFNDEVSILELALLDEDEQTRRDAVEALGEIGNDKAIEALLGALVDDDSYQVRGDATEMLGILGVIDAVESLIQALLEDGSTFVRRKAAEALGVIGDIRAVEPLIQALLEDEYFETRGNAATALGLLGDNRAVEPLIQTLLEDESSPVRNRTAEALGVLGDDRAVEPLIQALLGDDEATVRRSAAEALGEIGDIRAVEALTQALNDESSMVQYAAQQALNKIQGG